ncbi:MAG: ABC transporter ATP-binding protein [Wenzhouxiangella sp.]|nr:ABC transporter ATP-binding protein [Wenzhouxiangella sp.]TVR95341.1 MAG: ABC transporter ATP-binding protein [Wenzhouxiangellaceae bacterium]
MALLSTKGLSVQIGDVVVVENLSIEVGPGQFWGLLGPNGVGKTTLLKTLAGVHPARAGQVLLDGKPLGALKRRTIARRLGMLPQHTQYVFEASCEQTALVGRHPHLRAWDRESAADRAMARQALASLGLEELAERSCMNLSGGESRRLALATVLVQDPAVMLLDEPTNHLDPANQVTILDVLGRQVRGHDKAAVMALHEVNLATCYCTHVLLLYGNGEYEAGPTEQLLDEQRLSRLYQCKMRLVDDGSQRVFAVAGQS